MGVIRAGNAMVVKTRAVRQGGSRHSETHKAFQLGQRGRRQGIVGQRVLKAFGRASRLGNPAIAIVAGGVMRQ